MTIRMTMKALLPVAILLAAPALAQDDPASAYAQAKADTASLERFIRQQEDQVKSQEAEIASLERQLVEIDTTNRQVQPLLEQMVNTLARFVELDVPFLLGAAGPKGKATAADVADGLLLAGMDREDARRQVQPRVNAMIGRWVRSEAPNEDDATASRAPS